MFFLARFFSPYTNKRTDKYGGSLKNRLRFAEEIAKQARKKVETDFPIQIKVNSNDRFHSTIPENELININNFYLLAREIEKAGFNAINVSGRGFVRKDLSSLDKQSYFVKYAESINVNIPVIVTGGNRSLSLMEQILQNNKVDFFGLARPFIREPDLANRWLEGQGDDSCRCINCNKCILEKEPVSCIQENG